MIAETGTKIFYSYGGGSSPPGDVDALKRLMSETDRRIRMVLMIIWRLDFVICMYNRTLRITLVKQIYTSVMHVVLECLMIKVIQCS